MGTCVSNETGRDLRNSLDHVAGSCTECGVCVKKCGFLQQYGTPMKIAETFDSSAKEHQVMPFECSLCGLCSAVCPSELRPDAMFLEMRRSAVRQGANDFAEYGGLLGYEQRGTSRRYSWYGLPAGCDTIFFPGCAIPGTRPDQTIKLFAMLSETVPNLGIVFDCCTKPSLSLGRQEYFSAMFGELKDYLVGQGIRTVLVACPNCHKVFTEYAPELTVRTVYEVLAETGMPAMADGKLTGTVTIHDPCVSRFSGEMQSAARTLVAKTGLDIEEMPSSGRHTVCCGEGGAVACLNPELADEWGKKRVSDAAGRRAITYCAGCTNHLSTRMPTSHVVDLLLDPAAALAGKAKVSRAPFTYLNRLRLKRHFQKNLAAAVIRERTFTAGVEAKKRGFLKPLLFFALLGAIISIVRYTGAIEYLEQEKLRGLIHGYGSLAPIIYMMVYAVAPSLFLPGLPITIVGGILFGPFWGVVYTIVGATVGASIAFLTARHVARNWVTGKLKSPRWKKLDSDVEKHGWKVVAFTRLIPLFPFNLLNYAFGLTRVRFSHYVIATFVFMLPACIAFIVFSSSLLDLLKGRISPTFLVGLGLVVLVSMIPGLHRRYRQKRERGGRTQDIVPEGDVSVEGPRTYDMGRSLRVKLITVSVVLSLAILTALLVRHYFWAINAHVYTLEFNFLFILSRLRDGDLNLFTDYLRPMGPVRGMFALLQGHLLQEFWSPFARQILVPAGGAAFGAMQGFFFNFIGMMATGLMALGAGRFLFGDIMPVLELKQGNRFSSAAHLPKAVALAPVLAAIPWLPLSFVAFFYGFLRIPFRRFASVLLLGILIRLLLSLVVY